MEDKIWFPEYNLIAPIDNENSRRHDEFHHQRNGYTKGERTYKNRVKKNRRKRELTKQSKKRSRT